MSEFKIVVEQAKAWLWERMGASGLEFGASQAGAFSCPPTSQARGPVGCATRFQARCSQWLSEGTLPRRHILSKTTDPSSICPCFLHAFPQKKKKITAFIRCYFNVVENAKGTRREACPTAVLHLIIYSASDYWMPAKCQALFWAWGYNRMLSRYSS